MKHKNKDSKPQSDHTSVSKIELVHEYTYPELLVNSHAIEKVLNAEELDSKLLFDLIEQRDDLVQSFLESLPEKPNANQKGFVEAEYKVNQTFTQYIHPLLQEAEQELHGFVRGRSAVKKYK